MSRILVTCPSSRLPVATGRHTPGIDLAILIGEHAFLCPCGGVHLWEADGAWVEDGQSLARAIAAEMTHLRTYLFGAAADGVAPPGCWPMQGHGTRLWRERRLIDG